MSVVERALKNMKKAAAQKGAPEHAVARIVEGDDTHVLPTGFGLGRREQGAAYKYIEFDLDELREAGFYPAGNQRLADEYRLIKRPILKTATADGVPEQERGNLLMVGSALPGEGKTFTSINLSMSLASEKDWNVLLVDVDCKNPQLSRLLGVDNQPGMLDFLRNDSRLLESLILATNIDGLYVLPLGTPGEEAAELLASDRMSALCDSLSRAERRQIVVFDSSPILLTTEPTVLSGQVGQIVIVVQANQTPRRAIVEAVEKLGSDAAVGIILNRVDDAGKSLRYGSYGVYGPY